MQRSVAPAHPNVEQSKPGPRRLFASMEFWTVSSWGMDLILALVLLSTASSRVLRSAPRGTSHVPGALPPLSHSALLTAPMWHVLLLSPFYTRHNHGLED